MVKKILLLISVLSLLSFSGFSIWFVQYSYEQSKSKFTRNEMIELQAQFEAKLEDETIPIDRAELVSIIKKQHSLNISKEEYAQAQFSSSNSMAELLATLLLIHLAILFFTVELKGKPRKQINSDQK
ncbi:hypothetical protein MHM98_12070 [Psychrobium sp. MM17-31]|uniref:hypothetical protein n=1 Tax=Psychrobium sp. MM17-31 TaxID=2917758 RepID=UPI001EF6961A|nr:hypothetical protein [Psychrobium sp. MM17-31]MCG7532072.1 hypothetical protein [Psychrobium sp. MM17-31]